MPSSRPHAIPIVLGLLQQVRPTSILDVGVGFGKWGHLFREYTDIVAAEEQPERYEKPNWQTRIDGIEGHSPYLTAMHSYLYDQIHIGSAQDVLPHLGSYDFIFLGDVIEHLPKGEGETLLQAAIAHADRAVVVSTPARWTVQLAVCGNEFERHRSQWTVDDFRSISGAVAAEVDGEILIAAVSTGSFPPLELKVAAAPPRWKRVVRNGVLSALGEKFLAFKKRNR